MQLLDPRPARFFLDAIRTSSAYHRAGVPEGTTEVRKPPMGDIHIVVVDDEPEVRDMIRDYLAGNGYAVSAVAGGGEMRSVLAERPANLVILDLRMPGEDGLSLARYLKEQGPIGIIMVTASAEVIDRVVGLELGADDYIAKPFDPRELLARVRSVLRRMEQGSADRKAPSAMAHEIRMGRCMLNLQSGRLYTLVGEDVPLTSMEFELLKAFASRPNRVLSRDQLLDLAHNKDMEAFDRSIDIRIMRLRRKIEENPDKPQVLKTVRGLGYMFATGEGRAG
jgi:DNA-binding response OmpR family regulator